MNDASASDSSPLPAQSGTFALVDLRSGQVHPLQPGPNSIGRSPKSRVVLDDPAISRRHAVLMVYEEGNCEVGDAASRNGVRVNGRRLAPVAPLKPGDVLQIGDFRLLFTDTSEPYPPRSFADETLGSPYLFADETLGVVVWRAADACWHFGIPIEPDRIVPAVYSPTDYAPPSGAPSPTSPEWEVVRACFQQVKAREGSVRARIARQDDPFGRYYLAQILFTSTAVTLVYERGSSGTQAVCVSLNSAGEVISGPQWIAECKNGD